ncbi:MAG: putative lipid II flippase MurJ [Patescibacteria group bacterium]|nr:MAG: putative lipid II flippase MurJ [Patescibacteria group bacterium]
MTPNINTTKPSGFLYQTQNTILSAAFIIAASNGINALLGFFKNRLLAHYFGVSNDLAVFYTADRIPNLVYSVLIVGGVSTVFIPIFAEGLKKNKEEAFKTASSMVSATLLFFLVLTLIVLAFSTPLFKLVSLGKFSVENATLGVSLMRIMMLSQILLVLGSLSTSILQTYKYFLVTALAPLAYSLGMILGIVFLSQRYGIYAPAIGVAIGALLHFLLQLPALLRTGFRFIPKIGFHDTGLRNMARLVPPRILSVLLANLIQVINNSLAILVSTSSVIFLKFAMQLQSFPVSLFGISLGAASLPTLSTQCEKEDLDKFKETFVTSLMQMLYLVLPLSMLLLVLRGPVVRIVYGVANFPWEATLKTSYTLAFFSISIFAQSANYLLTRAFYAYKDTKTPVMVSLVTTAINVALSLLFIMNLKFGVWAVALSFSITSILDTVILFAMLNKKLGGFDIQKILTPFVKISYATLIMGFALYIPVKLLDRYIFDTTRTINLLALVATAGLFSTATYVFITTHMKVAEVDLFYKLIKRLAPAKKAVPFIKAEEDIV